MLHNHLHPRTPCSSSHRFDIRKYGTTASGWVRHAMRCGESVKTYGTRAGRGCALYEPRPGARSLCARGDAADETADGIGRTSGQLRHHLQVAPHSAPARRLAARPRGYGFRIGRVVVERRGNGDGGQDTFGWSRRTIVIWAIVFVVVLGALSIAAGAALDGEELSQLVTRLRSLGSRWWAPVALIAAFVVINLVGIPGTPLTLAAGVVWGWLAGGLWVMAAVMAGTTIPYLIARRGVPRLRATSSSASGR